MGARLCEVMKELCCQGTLNLEKKVIMTAGQALSLLQVLGGHETLLGERGIVSQ